MKYMSVLFWYVLVHLFLCQVTKCNIYSLLDEVFEWPSFPAFRVTSCLLFLRILLRNALINKEGSWKWFSCKTHSSALSFNSFPLFCICYLMFILAHDLKSGLPLLIQAYLHDILENALWLVLKVERIRCQLISLRMFMSNWTTALHWILLRREHILHSMVKRYHIPSSYTR